MFRKYFGQVVVLVVASWLSTSASGGEQVISELLDSGKVGQNALSLLSQSRGERPVEVDLTFSVRPFGTPFYRPGLDDGS